MNNGNSTRYNRFNKFIPSSNLIDIGSIGNPFMWQNCQNEYAVCARLDRTLTNLLWLYHLS